MDRLNIYCAHTTGEFFVASMKMEFASPSSSPPTPPSPLPVSVGPGSQHYLFSSSPSPSPPFSPPSSAGRASPKDTNLLLNDKPLSLWKVPSAFSLDRRPRDDELDSKGSSCLKDLFEWLLLRCCSRRRSPPPQLSTFDKHK